eukprot:11171600-Lingulodinium_polyedra.AAC.1
MTSPTHAPNATNAHAETQCKRRPMRVCMQWQIRHVPREMCHVPHAMCDLPSAMLDVPCLVSHAVSCATHPRT